MGGLIFYYISDTHNIQKRQAGEAHREKLYYITLFSCSHLFCLHVQKYKKFNIAFITVKYIIECLMRMQIYQLNLMCFLGENLSLAVSECFSSLLCLELTLFICCNDRKLRQIKKCRLGCRRLNAFKGRILLFAFNFSEFLENFKEF